LSSSYRITGPGIRKLYPNIGGTRVIYIDNSGDGFIYNPVNDHIVKIPNFPSNYLLIESKLIILDAVVKVMWDSADWGVFVAAEINCSKVYTYVYQPNLITGGTAVQIAVSKFTTKYTPVLVHNGILTVQVSNLIVLYLF
jgi:WD repeat-containing protein 19